MLHVNNDAHIPMSQLSKDWIFLKIREYELPYVKRLYGTIDAVGDEWVATVVANLDKVQSNILGTACKISSQLQVCSLNNKVIQNKGNGTSYNWRDSRLGFTCDIFYTPTETAHRFALDWQAANDNAFIGENGCFSKRDIRYFWGSYGNHDLTSVWPCYYESEEVYKRLLAIKKAVDPQKIFSPNPFCIGGAKDVERNDDKIKKRKHL